MDHAPVARINYLAAVVVVKFYEFFILDTTNDIDFFLIFDSKNLTKL